MPEKTLFEPFHFLNFRLHFKFRPSKLILCLKQFPERGRIMTRKIGMFIVFVCTHCSHAIQGSSRLPQGGYTSPFGEPKFFLSRPIHLNRQFFIVWTLSSAKWTEKNGRHSKLQPLGSSGVYETMAAGSEIPYPSSSFSSAGSGTTKNYNYRSVGVQINCTVKEGTDSLIGLKDGNQRCHSS